ncbi:MAG: RHS repeat-associated core domain-containing protein [bacterium]
MSSYSYKPFGDTLWTTTGSENRLGFIGRERDYENNYFAFGARNYDSETGRFLSVDPFFEAFPNQTPYHYAYNSPIQFKDPSGLAPEKEKKERVQTNEFFVYIDLIEQTRNLTANEVNTNMDAWDDWCHGGADAEFNSIVLYQKWLNWVTRGRYGIGGSGGGSGGSGGTRSTGPRTGDNGTVTITIAGIPYTINYDIDKITSEGFTVAEVIEKFVKAIDLITATFEGFCMLHEIGSLNIDITMYGRKDNGNGLADKYTGPNGEKQDFIFGITVSELWKECPEGTNSTAGTFEDGKDKTLYIAFELFTEEGLPRIFKPKLFGLIMPFYVSYSLSMVLDHEITHLYDSMHCNPGTESNAMENMFYVFEATTIYRVPEINRKRIYK